MTVEQEYEYRGWQLVAELVRLRDASELESRGLRRHEAHLEQIAAGSKEPHRFFFIATETRLELQDEPDVSERLRALIDNVLTLHGALKHGKTGIFENWHCSDMLAEACRKSLIHGAFFDDLSLLKGLLSVPDGNACRALNANGILSETLQAAIEEAENEPFEAQPFFQRFVMHMGMRDLRPSQALGTGDLLNILREFPEPCRVNNVLRRAGLDADRLQADLAALPPEDYGDRDDGTPEELAQLRSQVMERLRVWPDQAHFSDLRGRALVAALREHLPQLPLEVETEQAHIGKFYPSILADDPDAWREATGGLLTFEHRYPMAAAFVTTSLAKYLPGQVVDLASRVAHGSYGSGLPDIVSSFDESADGNSRSLDLPQKVEGSCHCGSLGLCLSLSRSPEYFSPRHCTCDFCSKQCAGYLSDPLGSLSIEFDEANLGRYRQEPGGAAEFLFCRNCGVLIAVVYLVGEETYGAANVRALNGGFGKPQVVAPHKLPKEQRLERWKELWFRDVRLIPRGGR